MNPVRTGIVGFGRIGAGRHLERMRASSRYEVVAVCDVTPARRQLAEQQGLKAVATLDELLEQDLEAVVIATHSSAHYEAALQVAAAGKHMLIEKPVAMTADETEAMIRAAERNGVVLSVYHNRHNDPDHRLVKAAVRDGLVGELIFVENRTMSHRAAVGFGVPEFNQQWRVTAAMGGGALLDFGPHWVEQILDLMEGRRVVQVWGDVRHIKWGDADDHFRIEMVFDNGTRAAAGKTDFAFASPRYKWFAVGTEATLRWNHEDEAVLVNGPDFELKRRKAVEAADLHDNFAAHLRGEAELVITPAHALRVMQVLSAGVASARAGKSVDVEI